MILKYLIVVLVIITLVSLALYLALSKDKSSTPSQRKPGSNEEFNTELDNIYKNELIQDKVVVPSDLKEGYVILSGPAPDSKSAWKGIDKTPTLYLFGGTRLDGTPNKYIYILENKDIVFKEYGELDLPLPGCKGTYVPQYAKVGQLGLFVLVSPADRRCISYNIETKKVSVLYDLPSVFSTAITCGLEFVDNVSGPLYVMMDKAIPKVTKQIADTYGSCARNRNIWITEGSKFWYINTNENGDMTSNWGEGPTIPYPVHEFQFGRVFIRHQNIKWGVTSCAMICVYGGIFNDSKKISNKMQVLTSKGKVPSVNYMVITDTNSENTMFPRTIFNLPEPVYGGVGLTSQWPEMLVTGARCIVVGYNKHKQVRLFMIELRFGDSIFGNEYKWQSLKFDKLSSLKDIITAAPLDQHYNNIHFRKSNFLIVTKSEGVMNLQLGPIQYYVPVESALTTSTTKSEYNKYNSIYKKLATQNYFQWNNLFRRGKADKFINMDRTPFVDNIGVPFMVSSDRFNHVSFAYTLLYRMAWIGKVFIRNWDNSDQVLVTNKFTKLGNKFYHPLCPDNVGIDTNGRIVKQGISLLDGDYCWVLTYGCEAGKRMIPTVPPIPTSSIRDELRYVEYNNKTIIVGNTYIITKIYKPILSLFFALVPVGNIYLK